MVFSSPNSCPQLGEKPDLMSRDQWVLQAASLCGVQLGDKPQPISPEFLYARYSSMCGKSRLALLVMATQRPKGWSALISGSPRGNGEPCFDTHSKRHLTPGQRRRTLRVLSKRPKTYTIKKDGRESLGFGQFVWLWPTHSGSEGPGGCVHQGFPIKLFTLSEHENAFVLFDVLNFCRRGGGLKMVVPFWDGLGKQLGNDTFFRFPNLLTHALGILHVRWFLSTSPPEFLDFVLWVWTKIGGKQLQTFDILDHFSDKHTVFGGKQLQTFWVWTILVVNTRIGFLVAGPSARPEVS